MKTKLKEMNPKRRLVDKNYLLEKSPGKGGWTYVLIPEVLQDRHAWFGWVKVSGFIDTYEIKNYSLMPMGNGQLFLPVKSEIRKQIGKQEGDWVHVVLYTEHPPVDTKEDFFICLEDDTVAHTAFLKLTEEKQKELINWIASAKSDEAKVERIARTLTKLSEGNI